MSQTPTQQPNPSESGYQSKPMTQPATQTATSNSVDIASIVEQVLRRLRDQSGTSVSTSKAITSGESAHVLSDKVISVDVIQSIPSGVTQVQLSGGIVTPAAHDEMRARGITVAGSKSTGAAANQPASKTGKRFIQLHTDASSKSIRDSLTRQLSLRGLDHCPKAHRSVVVTARPAAALIARIQSGSRAVLITRLEDISRFASEVDADTFVLDMQHFNLVALVNAANTIAQLPKPSTSTSQGTSR
ncbi:hypothetical protein RISK_005181 [Rhodopirellula islandica]|uniref:Uncharacterized protein n=1 Tax=Rhodopirellula islandica TaxID=595434 RepID=A0A0J1B7V9_RHOIS|nr:hypothetical protein [Rhodopirellula islandica]KLU02885.1 hypothetical protein RISK_005181 [Rhodopirellula islandica]